jgi:hypothetical protein
MNRPRERLDAPNDQTRKGADNPVNELVLIAGLLSFAVTSSAVKSHFSSKILPREVHFAAIMSYAGVTDG